MPLDRADPRRARFSELLRAVWQRYGHDLLVTETSELNESRPVWLRELTGEVSTVLAEGLRLHGVCLYPILGMPEWHARDEWTQMGLWDLKRNQERLERVLHEPMMEALIEAQWLEQHQARSAIQ